MTQPRKRDRLRNLVRLPGQQSQRPTASQPPSPGPSIAVSQSGSASQATTPSINIGEKLFHDTLAALTAEERATIQHYVAQGSQDIRTAVLKAQDATQRHKKLCEDKRWQWSFRGHVVVLRDVADKVVLWLDRFKSVGDVVANVAPLHVGLPWAGVRILLEMSVSDSRQMAALLTGMDLVLSIANRLEVYMMYHHQLPATLATSNLEKALAKTYAHIMKFFVVALQEYEKGTTLRVVQALWRTPSLEAFKRENDDLTARLEIEASNCDRELSAQRWQEAQRLKHDLSMALQRLDAIQDMRSSLNSLHVKVDLSKLVVVDGATYNSYADAISAKCLPGTRTDILQQIADWANNPNGRCVFWLCGMAGTGKSTISRSVAHTFDQQALLGASFFFKRGEGYRGSASRLFMTVAVQMADKIPGLDQRIASAVDSDSLLGQRNLQEQFEKLLLQPLLSLSSQSATDSVIVIVIDALDECDREMDVRMIISLLTQLHDITTFRLRVLLTSRPELPLRLGFQDVDGSLHQDVKLEDIQATTIDHDIRLFFQHSFKDIVKEDQSVNPYEPLHIHWPGNDAIESLIYLATPLFIFAFTVCRYISESDPRERLGQILQQDGNKSLTGIDKTYVPILNQLVSGLGERRQDQIFDSFQELVGAIVLVGEPLSAQSYSTLLHLSLRNISESLRDLHSVLNVPKNKDVPIRLFHLSFRDFLVDDGHSAAGRFKINDKPRHVQLAAQCLRRLSQEGILKDDLLSIEKPGVRRADIAVEQIENAIPKDVAYACSYWVYHFIQSKHQIYDDGNVHEFLKSHLLHWLEALSWFGRLSNAVAHIGDLISVINPYRSSRVAALLGDTKRFLLQNRHVVNLAPLQLYYSALVFAPTNSIVRGLFSGQYSALLSRLPVVHPHWSAEIQTLEGHHSWVQALAFSPDGQTVASASSDTTVRIWDAETGEETQRLIGHVETVTAVAFSPNGQIIASASWDKTVRLWDAKTGEVMQKLREHEKCVNTVDFSPDGRLVASASNNGTVQLCDVETGRAREKLRIDGCAIDAVAFSPDGQTLALALTDSTARLWYMKAGEKQQKLIGHGGPVTAVAFSPDGQTVASASFDTTVRIWDAETGEETQRLIGHVETVTAVAFPPNGQIIASASYDLTVRLWDVGTGEEIQRLNGHYNLVTAVAFSPDGQIVASAAGDNTVRLWKVKIGEELQELTGHNKMVYAIAFSPDGQSVASASEDTMVHLWDVKTGERRRRLIGHDNMVVAVAFSPDGRMVASASDDKTVRIWDAETGEEVQMLVGHHKAVREVVFSPDGQSVASASEDKTVQLWDVKTGEDRQRPIGHDDMITAVAFSPDGRTVASASGDKTVRLWDAKTGKTRQKLEGHDDTITALAFSPDGGSVASASWYKTLRIWDAKTGEQRQRLEAPSNIRSLAFASDGQSLATDKGRVELGLQPTTTKGFVCSHQFPVLLSEEWIKIDNEDVLWLPHDYRGGTSAVRGKLVVFGQASGMTFIEFY